MRTPAMGASVYLRFLTQLLHEQNMFTLDGVTFCVGLEDQVHTAGQALDPEGSRRR
jgi:hypothetical protein